MAPWLHSSEPLHAAELLRPKHTETRHLHSGPADNLRSYPSKFKFKPKSVCTMYIDIKTCIQT